MSARELPHVDLVAYLLGSLEDDERTGVERHIDGCAVCSAEAVQLGPAASLLGRAAPQVAPPADLERRTLAAVARAAGAENAVANGKVHEAGTRFERPPASAPEPAPARAGAWPGGAPPWPRAWPWLWPPRCSPARS